MINLLSAGASFLPYYSLISLVFFSKVLLTDSWREALVYAFVLWGFLLFVLTEALSFFKLLEYFPILLSWAVLLLFSLTVLMINRSLLKKKCLCKVDEGRTDPLVRVVYPILIIIFVLTAVTSFLCPPNTYDSLTYHIARVAHWVQNRTVAFYPTHIVRQVVSPMWLEYAALHFQILSRGDYFANSIQWVSMVGSVLGVSLIARNIGVSWGGQLVAAVVAATIPMGIIQASSMQGDYATALWLVSAVSILLNSDLSWKRAIFFSLSLGLAFLTRGTGVVFGVSLIIGFLIKIRLHAGKFLVFWFIILLMMSGYLIRNYEASPRSISLALDGENAGVKLRDISYSTVMANSIRNAGMQLATGSAKINRSLEKGLYRLGSSLGVDLNDPKATFEHGYFHLPLLSRDESYATNGMHFILYLICFLMAISMRPPKGVGEYFLYVLGMLLGLVLFIRWQIWSGRFQLPLFVLSAPIVGYVYDRVKIRLLAIVVIVLLFILAIPYLMTASPRHLLGQKSFLRNDRIHNLFTTDTGKMIKYASVVSHVQSLGCKQIGLIITGNSWDYPFYRMLNPDQDKTIRIEHVNVDNFTKAFEYPLGPFNPCAIISLPSENELKFRGRSLKSSDEIGGIKVFKTS